MSNREPQQTPSYWFNLNTKEIEFGLLAPAIYRVGPFATKEEAELALEMLAARAKAWREEEERDK